VIFTRIATRRIRKYDAKVGGMVIPGQEERFRGKMQRQVDLENMVRQIIGFDINRVYYIIFAKELNKMMEKHKGSTLTDEADIMQSKWYNRGLDNDKLNEIKDAMNLPEWTPPAPPAPWYNDNWLYRKKITIQHIKVYGTQTNFPVLVSIATDADFAAHAKADGSDFVFTSEDKVSKLKRELEYYNNANGNIIIWVKVDSINDATDVDIYLYYGNGAAAEGNDTETWDTNYKLVCHMTDETTSKVFDSSQFNHDGTKIGANEPIESSGEIYKSQDHDGANDYINFGHPADFDITAKITLQAWIRSDTWAVDDSEIAAKTKGGAEKWMFECQMNTGKIRFRLRTAADANIFDYSTTNGISTSVWHHIVCTYDGANAYTYVDGVQDGTAAAVGTIGTTDADFCSGAISKAARWFDGKIDEIRISDTNRSENWVKTEQKNQSDPGAFIDVGAEENKP